jgi:hypothetical protein
MTDSKRRRVDFEDPSQFALNYSVRFRGLLMADEDIWRSDAEDFPSGVPRDRDAWGPPQSDAVGRFAL